LERWNPDTVISSAAGQSSEANCVPNGGETRLDFGQRGLKLVHREGGDEAAYGWIS